MGLIEEFKESLLKWIACAFLGNGAAVSLIPGYSNRYTGVEEFVVKVSLAAFVLFVFVTVTPALYRNYSIVRTEEVAQH
ncbi:hypothetical protein C437_04745 [Haloarcula vallismortis ATCC 29715]|uniref:Uncharacterized protein n=1 Tax=Haloarcula vallismortis ATCC 29715 TaxID=662477 RepID=M0JLP9_HALVA|nr:hypothetical protein [Haloarcula vallismortis]EMA09936.1 hypothetical protein C437_04745 [Haloarcula vallismortis ATCC 29715]